MFHQSYVIVQGRSFTFTQLEEALFNMCSGETNFDYSSYEKLINTAISEVLYVIEGFADVIKKRNAILNNKKPKINLPEDIEWVDDEIK